MFGNTKKDKKQVEFWENEYLQQIYYLLMLDKDKMLGGLDTKEDIRKDWEKFLSKTAEASKDEISRGAERIFYWLFNQFGIPNSSPIGADMFFETYNSYIHIDIKTVRTTNKGDFKNKITIEKNQTSYSGYVIPTKGKDKGKKRNYIGNLPKFYTKKNGMKKLCLTYFITILYDPDSLEIQWISLINMPNGKLHSEYGDNILEAGKNKTEARFKYSNALTFKLLPDTPSRIKVLYWKEKMDTDLEKYFITLKQIFESQDH